LREYYGLLESAHLPDGLSGADSNYKQLNTDMKIAKLAVIAAVASLFAASCCPSAAPAPAPAPVSAK
jgi:hypothetical protein